ncbi:hypothetical protein OESDEN_15294 [Oesophagostomum dentatum]|uniref:Uncharacterized protein n=1 Tax=Oesophagostomum dentatum TaxID=61180 RepID=A0A0B1SM73_OESDE|nr:hypothetical protein OESDEN_15294 [Oesophagostomum dentatum]
MFLLQAFKKYVKEAEGRIVAVSSVNGRLSSPGAGPYVVSKFGAEALHGCSKAGNVYDECQSLHSGAGHLQNAADRRAGYAGSNRKCKSFSVSCESREGGGIIDTLKNRYLNAKRLENFGNLADILLE